MKTTLRKIILPTVFLSLVFQLSAQEVYSYSDTFILITFPSVVNLNNYEIPPHPDVYKIAGQTLNLSNTAVTSGGSIILWAGQNIRIQEETSVSEGGYLLAGIIEAIPTLRKGGNLVSASDTTIIETEINNDVENAYFRVFPNPTTGRLYVEFLEIDFNDNCKVQIFDLFGDIILEQQIAGHLKAEFDLSSFPCGIYFARLVGYNKLGCIKLIRL